jgi:hypothetical protein
VNRFRRRAPDHPAAPHQSRRDSGELTNAAEDMFDFAQQSRKEREERLHGDDVKRRAKRKTK